ncbi:MAG TPA: hypothetical protein VMM38_09890 [Aridibacter sp.]|nr:hypothetical protein [Aridibacter sp.]
MKQFASVFAIVIAVVLALGACGAGGRDEPGERERFAGGTGVSESGSAESQEPAQSTESPDEAAPEQPYEEACAGIDPGEKAVLKSQTFPFSHAPFKGACFVTLHEPDFTDPPLGSEIAIYRDGERVYSFYSAYDADSATCWVIAVGFRDIDDDGLTDVIVAGKCGAKSGPIVTNEVHVNTGSGFSTDFRANDRLENFSTINQIADFAKRNRQLFSR